MYMIEIIYQRNQLFIFYNYFQMHEVRNVLYQIKKESNKRSNPLYEPDDERDNLREQLATLRTHLRNKDTQIIRLHAQIDQLSKRITLFQLNSKLSPQSDQENQEKQMQAFSQIPMIFENKELKQSNEQLHRENLELNGKNNLLTRQARESESDIKRLEMRLKELQILQKMREQRFKDEVDKITPIIVEENKDFSYLKQGITKVTSFLREFIFNVIFEMFLKCAKDCEKEKKVSSYSIFKNYWTQLKSMKSLGLQAAVKSYESLKKLALTLDETYAELSESSRDTMNEWVLNTIVEIKHSNFAKQKEQKLFRLLSLYYRSKFPIKGQHFDLDKDIRCNFQDFICHELNIQLQS